MDYSAVAWFGLLAGVLQLVGYITYIKLMGDDEIEPNPYTWLMFAYGTFLLTLLELDNIFSVPELDMQAFFLLILPTVCSSGAILVFWLIWSKNRSAGRKQNVWWPSDRGDQISLLMDITITVCYLITWFVLLWALMTAESRMIWAWWLLFLSNVSTFPGFFPMIREVWHTPETEDWRPWMVWAIAYTALAYSTWLQEGLFWHALMFYPASNAVMHGLIAVLALRRKKDPEIDRYKTYHTTTTSEAG